jgi:hypothetical protein
MKPSIAQILRRIRPCPPRLKCEILKDAIAQEPLRSIRRRELESELQRIITKQIGRENRQDRRVSA